METQSFDKSIPLQPVERRLLLARPNEPAREKVPIERLSPAAARSFMLRTEAGGRPSIEPFLDVDDAWTIATQSQLAPGVLGRRRLHGQSVPKQKKSSPQREGLVNSLECHIPSWVGRGYNATIAPTYKNSSRRRTKRGYVVDHENEALIFDGESRVSIFPNNYPECCICEIFIYTSLWRGGPLDIRAQATGFMVGPRLMLTSGHARPPQPYSEWMIRVVPASYDGASLFGNGFLTYASDYLFYDSDPGNDMMLLRLYDDIGSTTGYFGAIPYDDDWEGRHVFSMCGYPYDIGSVRPAIEVGIAVQDDDDGDNIELPDGSKHDTTEIETRADSASGASGSPIYSWFSDGGMYAIGVNKGIETEFDLSLSGFTDTHEVASGGDGLVELIRWGRANWS